MSLSYKYENDSVKTVQIIKDVRQLKQVLKTVLYIDC